MFPTKAIGQIERLTRAMVAARQIISSATVSMLSVIVGNKVWDLESSYVSLYTEEVTCCTGPFRGLLATLLVCSVLSMLETKQGGRALISVPNGIIIETL